MKKFVLIAAGAAALLFAPAAVTSTPANAQSVHVQVGTPSYGYVRPAYTTRKKVVYRTTSNCRYTTVRTKRPNGTVYVKKIRRCR